jgi:hypothetical protein
MHAKRYAVGSVTTAYVTAKLWYLSDDTVRWTGENTGGTILWYQAPPDTLWKCSETDAIGKCCAAIGIGAEVYLDTFDGEKSESGLEPGAECPKCGIPLEISPSPGHLMCPQCLTLFKDAEVASYHSLVAWLRETKNPDEIAARVKRVAEAVAANAACQVTLDAVQREVGARLEQL